MDKNNDFAKVYRLEEFGQVVILNLGTSIKIVFKPRVPGVDAVEMTVYGTIAGVDVVSPDVVFRRMDEEHVADLCRHTEQQVIASESEAETKH